MQYYDQDKLIPAYGFGARLNGFPSTYHKFALNGDFFKPECNGLDGVIAAYHRAVQVTNFHGPTNFSEILSDINDRCRAIEVSQYNQKYYLLMILTDGIISDMEKTIDEIVRGSDLPLSIVIVGVGRADFSAMDVLDADDKPLFSRKYNKQMSRDIVQFVPFEKFKDDKVKLAKEVLTELPGQVVDFFMARNITPNPAKEEQRQLLKN